MYAAICISDQVTHNTSQPDHAAKSVKPPLARVSSNLNKRAYPDSDSPLPVMHAPPIEHKRARTSVNSESEGARTEPINTEKACSPGSKYCRALIMLLDQCCVHETGEKA